MPFSNSTDSATTQKGGGRFARNAGVLALVVVVWLVLDRATKVYFDSFDVGDVVANLAGILRLDLVHNTGMAWGAFAGQVPVIVIFTAVLCAAILAFALYWARDAGVADMVALGLLLAGGLGNLYDRVVYGYVVDFITPLFIEFPTFNVADIGVTCGVVLLAIIWIVQAVREGKAHSTSDSHNKEGE